MHSSSPGGYWSKPWVPPGGMYIGRLRFWASFPTKSSRELSSPRSLAEASCSASWEGGMAIPNCMAYAYRTDIYIGLHAPLHSIEHEYILVVRNFGVQI